LSQNFRFRNIHASSPSSAPGIVAAEHAVWRQAISTSGYCDPATRASKASEAYFTWPSRLSQTHATKVPSGGGGSNSHMG
jgi:hypothetical protein